MTIIPNMAHETPEKKRVNIVNINEISTLTR